MSSLRSNKVSIILVNWNGRKWLPKCLSTLSNQTYKNIEIIFVDNCSSDNSVAYVKKKFPKIIIIENSSNTGFSTAANVGVRAAKGKYLLIVNIDTWVENNFIERLVKFYKKNSFSVISPTEKRYDKSTIKILNTTIDPTGTPAFYIPKNKNLPFYLCTSYFLTKKDYIQSGGFDSGYFLYMEDVDWFWRINLLKMSYCYVPDVYIYHIGGGSVVGGFSYATFLWRNQNALQTLLKNYSIISLIVIIPVYLLQNFFEILFFLSTGNVPLVKSYYMGWLFNLKNLKIIIKKRKWIQKKRKVSDLEIIKKMYLGSAKLLHFRRIYKWV